MKILVGALVATLLALGLVGWRWQVTQEELAVTRERERVLSGELERQIRAGEQLEQRLTALDQSMARLYEANEIHARRLGETLAGIDRIERTEGDTDETLNCLDTPVPAQLDDWLRGAAGDHRP